MGVVGGGASVRVEVGGRVVDVDVGFVVGVDEVVVGGVRTFFGVELSKQGSKTKRAPN